MDDVCRHRVKKMAVVKKEEVARKLTAEKNKPEKHAVVKQLMKTS